MGSAGSAWRDIRYSVITPCLNAGHTIGLQLEALAAQEFPEAWEMVVVDNGSTDDTLAVVERYRGRIPQLRVVDASQMPRCIAHARNVGVEAARAPMLLFVDADDEIAPGWLAAMGSALERHGLVGCRIEYRKLNPAWGRDHALQPQQHGLADEYGFKPYCTSCGMGVRRDLHELVGGFDRSYRRLEDIDYCWRIQIAGRVTPGFVPEALLHYRLRQTSAAVFHQSVDWGFDEIFLYQRFARFGFTLPPWSPAGSWQRSADYGRELMELLPTLRDECDQLAWWKWAGYYVGCMEGCDAYGFERP